MIHLTGNEHLLNAILDYCDDIITVKDLNLNYLACNKAFLKHLCIKDANSIIGKSVNDIIPQSCLDIVVENAQKVITELRPFSYTLFLEKNSFYKILKQTATPIIRNGVIENILTVSTDVTNEESLKAKLIDKNYQLKSLIENLPFLVYMKDTNKNLIVATESAANFVYNGVDKFSNGLQLDISKTSAETLNEDNYVLQNKKHLSKEKSALDMHGRTHWYKIQKAPILTDNNEVNGIVTIAENIDKEKQLETQKNLFLATLTHDLKNPLQAQISSLEMLFKQFTNKISDEEKEILELIIDSSKYMRTMLCSLLKTCKESDGVIQLERVNLDMKRVIERSVKEIRDLAANKNITLIINSDTQRNVIFADELQMRRVICNLLNNAVNYAFENTKIKISLLTKNKNFILRIENKSDIITDKLKTHIFDKYVCGDNLSNNSQIGLGLYFCRKIVEAHEGEIRLHNNQNSNVFEIELPYTNENSALISQVVL